MQKPEKVNLRLLRKVFEVPFSVGGPSNFQGFRGADFPKTRCEVVFKGFCNSLNLTVFAYLPIAIFPAPALDWGILFRS
jgi:hypothetical protein